MYSDDEEFEFAIEATEVYRAKVPALSTGQREAVRIPGTAPRLNKEPGVNVVHYDKWRSRLYYGLESGVVCFWQLTRSTPGTPRYVGTHKGSVTAICVPAKDATDLGRTGLIVTGSVDSTVKLWDYQGKVQQEPTVLVQTLYGHSGTVTSIVVKGAYLLTGSTDRTIRVWAAGPGRDQVLYPWFEQQVRRQPRPVGLRMRQCMRCVCVTRGHMRGTPPAHLGVQ